MAKIVKGSEEVVEEKKDVKFLIGDYLKKNATEHYNFEETYDYKVSSSSLLLDIEVSLGPGCSRFMGSSAVGKSSCALSYMKNFLKEPGRRGIYFKSEGRLSNEMKARSGIAFTTDFDEFIDGTCLIIESNIFEFCFGLTRELITKNDGTKFFFIYDSADAMVRKMDDLKGFDLADQVAGGSLLSSVFFKKTALALGKRGHIAIFISQWRQAIKINQYEKQAPRQGSSSGGAALQHYSNLVLDFQPRVGSDYIRENSNDKNSKILGHYCTVIVEKSDNEKYKTKISWPVAYNRTGGNSVWVELEIRCLLQQWSLVTTKGAWTYISEEFKKELLEVFINDNEIEIPDKFNGISALDSYLENNPKIISYLFDKFKKAISN